jgi:hypothetical protein
VIPDRVKEPIRVGDDARRRQGDDLIQPRRVSIGSFAMRLWSMSGVRRRISLEQIFRVADDLDRGRRCRPRPATDQVIGTPVRTSTSFSMVWNPSAVTVSDMGSAADY